MRRARVTEVDEIAVLAALTFPLACPPGSTPADQREFIETALSSSMFRRYLADPARTVLVAHDGGAQLVGYAMVVGGVPADPDVSQALTLFPTAELSKLYVHPARHRSGVASALMRAALDDARARSASGVWLGVNQLNTRAQAFYTAAGFRRVGVKHFQVGGRLEDDFVYERML